jgi:threonine synthase
LDTRQWLAELFHGPTLCPFKDRRPDSSSGGSSDHVLAAPRYERVTIVGADERVDTGVGGRRSRRCRRLPARRRFVILYPDGAVERGQRRQMTTVADPQRSGRSPRTARSTTART